MRFVLLLIVRPKPDVVLPRQNAAVPPHHKLEQRIRRSAGTDRYQCGLSPFEERQGAHVSLVDAAERSYSFGRTIEPSGGGPEDTSSQPFDPAMIGIKVSGHARGHGLTRLTRTQCLQNSL